MLDAFPDQVKLVFKNFPLRNHKFARKAASAVMAADRQGQFWAFHDRLMENYNRLSDQKVQEIAQALNLDEEQLKKDMNDPKTAARINQDLRDGKNAGVRGTPAIFINGRRLKNRSLEGFKAVIGKELAKAKKGGR